MKNFVCVILFFLLAEIYIQVKAAVCDDDLDCMHHGCENDTIPYCQIKTHHQHHSDDKKRQSYSGDCHCKDQPVKHPDSTQSVVVQFYVHCNQHSDCTSHKCAIDRPIPYCKHDYFMVIEIGRHCDCTGSSTAVTAAATTASVRSTTLTPLSTSACHTHTDCSGSICPSDKHPYCRIDRYSSTCYCTVCTEHNHCFCPLGMIGQCHFDYLHNFHSCVCGIAPVVTTTTSVLPPTVTPLSTTACHAHTDCSGHICPSYKYPYCKFDRYSSTCHCTVCTEHKHCFCPQGLIGQCHFDYIHNSHSCVCGLPPDTTTTVSTLSTSKSVQTTTLQSTSVSSKSTTYSTQIPTTQQTTLSSTSTSISTTRMVSTPSSTSATSPTSTSVPSAKQGIRCPTCDESLNCVWNQTCYPEESCMIRSRYHGTKFTTHCTRKEDCSFIKNLMQNGEVFCCNDRVCLQTYLGV